MVSGEEASPFTCCLLFCGDFVAGCCSGKQKAARLPLSLVHPRLVYRLTVSKHIAKKQPSSSSCHIILYHQIQGSCGRAPPGCTGGARRRNEKSRSPGCRYKYGDPYPHPRSARAEYPSLPRFCLVFVTTPSIKLFQILRNKPLASSVRSNS